ncbi:LemA family protein [Noviherbaspirillum galbum]|uniref:LemA family protein n=1 Tax=Noviherbaspirillum galbum TaxID=2709383 RepID=A0A6B3SSY3_9BURK|nr:LemA family protein [Noviherbaspirillum galbum]NEX63877.1 LemA family protein [Noviherbaspirillum galbum]
MTATILYAALALVLVFWTVGAHKRFTALRLQCRTAFAQLHPLLRLRHDVVPGLVETLRAYLRDQREVLEMVIQACNAAIDAHAAVGLNPLNRGAMEKLGAAEERLDAALAGMFRVAQQFPEMRTDAHVKELLDRLSDAQSRAGFAWQLYQEAAGHYQAARRQFPGSIIAFLFGFKAAGALPARSLQRHAGRSTKQE